ncbi:MAG TPA: YfdX family protein [Trichormus sp.]|jgi:hypothetical protein
MRKIIPSILAASLALCGLTSSIAKGQEPIAKITSTVTVTPESHLNDQERAALSIAAGRLLVHVDQARQDLSKKDTDSAKKEVARASQLAEIIKTVMPGYMIKATVKAGDKSYSDQSEVKPLLVTVMENIGEIAVLEPVRAAKRGKVETKERLAGVEVQDTKAQLDVALAIKQLAKASSALDENNADQADQMLSSIETDDVDFSAKVADMLVQPGSSKSKGSKKVAKSSAKSTTKTAKAAAVTPATAQAPAAKAAGGKPAASSATASQSSAKPAPSEASGK